ncbi:hypothetical protein [Flavilitoribacter nigricans]|uniref:Uncharacterized protein n=1 Tax=Flavilitoribacter nigricans (strain ATCC 23147 / DSM 23189 / NBRC 102662 / NCIMB 1420 / SS-2) TaxID=1122177 RepID=A0A2D0MZ55_FLAN2|nr:hypothetical protein [Flavilitoribacter nigricans]PHN01561.1 hypothetical protein CRP01_36280 [Flavilitoribacter nigricans DSM 23189 = NBRC 102662]
MLTNMNGDHYARAPKIQTNQCSIERVFAKYEAVGFLYPAKKKLLAPHLPKITDHWRLLANSRERLLWILSANDRKKEPNFASISLWKQSNYGMFAQHLVSTGNPHLSLRIMLEAQFIFEHQFTEEEVRASQNWFRPNNRYAYRVFASMFEKLGDRKSALLHHHYLHLPLTATPVRPQNGGYTVEEVAGLDPELSRFVKNQYGEVFVRAEELDQPDIELRQIGRVFQRYGLQRFRKVWKVRDSRSGQIVACSIANRAPLGLNFSFLENRAYYILDQDLDGGQRASVLRALHHRIAETYRDIRIGVVPIVTDCRTAEVLTTQGAVKIREYVQSIWLREGFRQWYDHINSFLQRIERRDHN